MVWSHTRHRFFRVPVNITISFSERNQYLISHGCCFGCCSSYKDSTWDYWFEEFSRKRKKTMMAPHTDSLQNLYVFVCWLVVYGFLKSFMFLKFWIHAFDLFFVFDFDIQWNLEFKFTTLEFHKIYKLDERERKRAR